MSITTEYIPEPTRESEIDSSPVSVPDKLESSAFYIFLATVILAPIAFLPTPYVALDVVKTLVIGIGTIISAALYGIIAYKQRKVILPPKSVFWASIAVVVSLVVSSYTGLHAGKSFFGQGFELTSASFSLILFVAALVAFTVLRSRIERATVIYVGMMASFLILAAFHGLRFIFGASFATLGVLASPTATVLGTWYDLASYAVVIALIVISALIFLPLSRRMKSLYFLLLIAAFAGAFLINSVTVWVSAAVVLAGLAIYATSIRYQSGGFSLLIKSLAWIPVFACLVAVLFSWKGTTIAGPVITKMGTQHTALSLPWQISLDVAVGALKARPAFGVGPNQFSKAYIAYKPLAVNSTYAWSAEFAYAFSLLATAVATQGFFGVIAWGLFIVLAIVAVGRALRRLPSDPYVRFTIVSSSTAAAFLWILSAISVPSHTMLFYTYVLTAIALGSSVSSGVLSPYMIAPRIGARSRGLLSVALVLVVVVAIVWGAVYVKNSIALAYFGSGVKALTVAGDPVAADAAFASAERFNASDIYLQARAEAGIARSNQLIAQANASATGTTSQALIAEITDTMGKAISYAQSAVAHDPSNYYNYVSQARVFELATNIQMENGYDNAVKAYTNAIQLNAFNPTLYLNLAQLQASQNKLDDALKTVGMALQVKNNYLDAVFLLSQITAAQGNLADAITAAQVGTQINPQSPVLFFQLGLLQYTNKEYAAAAKSLETAVKLQPDYANAQYFLGLSYTRTGDITNAIAQFERLAATNPENEEVVLILANLKAGKSPFADARPPVTPTPEKRSSLPLNEKKK
ncbi:MAG: tetratricopeptide repeat protein [Patescibacteria group bacterium]|mgnify:CR=1 FL=1